MKSSVRTLLTVLAARFSAGTLCAAVGGVGAVDADVVAVEEPFFRGIIMRSLLGSVNGQAPTPQGFLKLIQVSVGTAIRMVPVEEVQYFEAADKYVRVLTDGHEYLIRTPLKELLPQLDPLRFWQVHRGTVVRAEAIDSVTRDEAGKLHVQLRGRKERLAVSRLYAHLFKAM